MASNYAVNPYKGTIRFDIVPIDMRGHGHTVGGHFAPGRFWLNSRMYLLNLTKHTNSLLQLYIDPYEGTVIRLGSNKFFLDAGAKREWYSHSRWKDIKIEYDVEQSHPYIKLFVDNEIVGTVDLSQWDYQNGLFTPEKLFIGFAPYTYFNPNQYFYLDEFRIYGDINYNQLDLPKPVDEVN